MIVSGTQVLVFIGACVLFGFFSALGADLYAKCKAAATK